MNFLLNIFQRSKSVTFVTIVASVFYPVINATTPVAIEHARKTKRDEFMHLIPFVPQVLHRFFMCLLVFINIKYIHVI